MSDDRSNEISTELISHRWGNEAAAKVGSWLWNPTTGDLSWSKEIYLLLGLKPSDDEPKFSAAYEVIHPEDLEDFKKQISRLSSAEATSLSADFRVIWPDGQIRILNDVGQFVVDPATGDDVMVGALRDVTDTRGTEQELQYFKATLDASRDGVFMNDADTFQYFYVNDGAVNYTGYTREELLNMRTPDLNPELDEEKLKKLKERLESGEDNFFVRTGHHRHKDGHRIPIESHTQLIKMPGQPPRFFTISRDISDRIEADREIHRFKALLDSTKDGVFLWDADTLDFTYVNAGVCDYTGYDEDELLGMKSYTLNPDIDEAAVRDAFAGLVSGEIDSLTRTGFHRHKDGRRIPVEVVTQYIVPPGDKPAFVSISRDISERLNREAEIRELNATLDQISDGVFVYDSETLKFLYANQSALAYLGYTLEELLELGPQDLNQTHSVEQIHQLIDDMRSGKADGIVGEVTHRAKDGTMVPVELGMRYVEEPNVLPRMVTVARDITERVKARAAAEQHQAELETRNEALSIANRQLEKEITERKQVEQSLQTRDQELRGLLHRLSEVQEAERTAISREIHDALGSSLTALRLDLLSLSKKSSPGDPAMAERTKRMMSAIDESIQTVRRLAATMRPIMLDDLGLDAAMRWLIKEFETRTDMHYVVQIADLPVLDEDRKTAIFRILQEALTNVARYSQASEVRVSVLADGRQFTLMVDDNGIGVSQEALTSPNSIGLIGMRERAAWFGGNVEVSQSPAGGTIVTARIPLAGLPLSQASIEQTA